jgi:N-acyl-D-amino-acid deacylase
VIRSKALAGILLLAAGLLAAAGGASNREAPFELLIVGARIVDGTGGPWYRGDIGIREGRIARIGKLAGAPAARVVDAAGRVAAPGFIDVHVHVEESLPADPDARNLLADGVTTILTGNCGASDRDVGGWLSRFSESGVGVNVGTLYGHNTARSEVMGNAGRAPTPRELVEMESLVRRAMRDGAMGFSTGLIYSPGTFAHPREIAALARVAGESGGIYATHMRSENDRVFESIEESIEAARAAGVPLQISHFKVTSQRLWGESARMLARVEAARAAGLDVTLDQYPYTASSSGLDVLLPDWVLAAEREGPRRAVERRLADRKVRRRIAAEMLERLGTTLGRSDLSYAVVAAAPWDASLEGKSLRQITLDSGARGAGAGDALAADIETMLQVCERGAASGRGGGACGTQMIYHSMKEEDVERIFASPLTMVARDGGVASLTAGNPHPRSFGTSARVLARYVRERGLVSLEEAVRKMTSLPAQRFGLEGRGLLREGLRADVVLFDPEEVADLSSFEDPHHDSRGFDLVLVNGVIVRDGGRPTCARPGMALYGPGYRDSIHRVARRSGPSVMARRSGPSVILRAAGPKNLLSLAK